MSDLAEDLRFLILRDIERGRFQHWPEKRVYECARMVGIHEESLAIAKLRLQIWATSGGTR